MASESNENKQHLASEAKERRETESEKASAGVKINGVMAK
jgi:hypothetical protein